MACFFSCHAAAAAEPDATIPADYEKVYLYRIVVAPLRAPQKLLHIPVNVHVLDQNELRDIPASDPAEALSYIPGVDVSPRTRFGHFTPLSIQGSESRQVLVMVDGIPFNTQASGQADVISALPLNNLDRIEVIQGPASSVWGSSLGGVINLVTKTPEHSPVPKGHVTGSWAEFHTNQQSFDVTGAIEKLDYFFSGEFRDAGGSRVKGNAGNRDDTLSKKGFGKVVYPLSDVLKATALYGSSDVEVNEGVYPSFGFRQHIPYDARYGLVRLEADPGERSQYEGAFKFNRQLIRVDSLDGFDGGLISGVRTADNYYGAELKNIRQFREEDTLVTGADLSYHILKSSQLVSARNIFFGAPYANYTMVMGSVDLIGGARYDFNEEFGEQFSPSLGAVLHAPSAPQTLLRVNVSRSFNAPPVLWRFFDNVAPGVTASNPDIQPERAWTYEAGMETRPWEKLFLSFKVHRSEIEDAIATVQRNGLFIKDNFNRFRQQGFTFESRLNMTKEWILSFASTFNDAEDLNTHLTVRNRGVTRPSFRLGLQGQAPGDVRLNLLGRYDRWDSSPSAAPNDRTFIFDGRLSKELTTIQGVGVTCFLNAYNLTNSKYWSDDNFPLPERYFEGGFTLEF